ncbi:alcohol dehydrogenase [Desulfuromonas versatilis]|uniref:Alcohol dehydrogenase n=1 Tax=Desulfuromonas versatilis TaxID=2802975 RepID=A0ABM8HRD2_9BACT|nr:alcohol dehydrogenase family protein [Desulfuromonas versatilis]BCR04473.1 alcohol dehydrogenase [Desulfuromonas versatilis]
MTDRPKTMRGVWLTGHGGMDKLDIRKDIPVPVPGTGEVLVRVAAAGINNTDINTRTAWYSKRDGSSEDASWTGEPLRFPRIQGADVCGHIVAVGPGVDKRRIGERVLIEPCIREVQGRELEIPWYLGSECDGGFAEYTSVASRHAYRVDSELSSIELASFPCSYSTAENLLTRAGLTEGERVLITGASGGVGSAAVQLAKARGAHALAVTSEEKSPALRQLGADEVLSREADLVEALGANTIDVVVDLVAGDKWPQYLEVLRPGGRYAVAGAIAGPLVELDVRTLYLKDLSLFGCTVLDPGVFRNLVHLIEQAAIFPLVARAFPLEEICAAQKMFMDKQHVGKIVLRI